MNRLDKNIAGAYIGAPIEWQGNRTAKVIDVIDTKYLSDCRLILTHLSDISDEDAVEVAKIGGCPYKVHEFIVQSGKELVTEYLDRTSNVTGLKWQHIIDYLRSDKRPDGTPKPVYDLGYMGIRSLIYADIAISSLDKTETK